MNASLRPTVLLGLSLGLFASLGVSQTCPLVFDINTIPHSVSSDIKVPTLNPKWTDSESFIEFGGEWYFSALRVNDKGRELFATDGTAAGTRLVGDVNPSGGSEPMYLEASGNGLFLSAVDGVHGEELWITDGVTMTMVKDIRPGAASSNPRGMTAFGAYVVFNADNGVTGQEPWISDGTANGTSLLGDLVVGQEASHPWGFTVDSTASRFLFAASAQGLGRELWISDGTAMGTTLLKDISPGVSSSSPDCLLTWNGRTYFSAGTDAAGRELWSTDGTIAGTQIVKDIWPGPSGSAPDLSHSAVLGGFLYFPANTESQGTELWRTDGTGQGTQMVADIWSGPNDSEPSNLTVAGSKLFFCADGGPGIGSELFVLNAGGAVALVRDIKLGGDDGLDPSKCYFTEANGKLLFTAYSDEFGRELWISDGRADGTHVLKDIVAGGEYRDSDPAFMTAMPGGSTLFSAYTPQTGSELWISDGTPAGTKLLVEVEPSLGTGSSMLQGSKGLTTLAGVHGTRLLLQADDGINGRELWGWDPTGGTHLIMDIFPGPDGSKPFGFYNAWLGGKSVALFTAYEPDSGEELWVTDGTTAGTHILRDLTPGPQSASPHTFQQLGNRVLFFAWGGSVGKALYATDGTAAGTTLLAQTEADFDFSEYLFDRSVELAGELYFLVRPEFSFGHELWKSDGTAAGTKLIMEVQISDKYDTYTELAVLNGSVYFENITASGNSALWSTDGTAAGTHVVSDTNNPDFGSRPSGLVVLGSKLLFFADDASGDRFLYSTDGTQAGTKQIQPISPYSDFPVPEESLRIDDLVYFLISPDQNDLDIQLWVTDGTPNGTNLIKIIGPYEYLPTHHMTAAGSGFYFVGNDEVHGVELWYSEGTAATTKIMCDLNPGKYWSSPEGLAFVNGSLFFRAAHALTGWELFHIPAAGPYASRLGADLSGSDAELSATTPKLGGNLTITCQGIPNGTPSLLLVSAPMDTPAAFMTLPASPLWLDPTTAFPVAWFTTSSWSLSQNLPAIPSLVGAQVTLQALVLSGGSFPAATSNGLSLVIGN